MNHILLSALTEHMDGISVKSKLHLLKTENLPFQSIPDFIVMCYFRYVRLPYSICNVTGGTAQYDVIETAISKLLKPLKTHKQIEVLISIPCVCLWIY